MVVRCAATAILIHTNLFLNTSVNKISLVRTCIQMIHNYLLPIRIEFLNKLLGGAITLPLDRYSLVVPEGIGVPLWWTKSDATFACFTANF